MRKSNGEGTIFAEIRNGKKYYRAQIMIQGKRKSFSGYKKTDVVKKMREAQVLADKNLYSIKGENTTFIDYYHYWLFEIKQPSVSNRTFEKYETEYRARLKNSPIAKTKLVDIVTSTVESYILKLKDDTSSGVAEFCLTAIRSCLNTALKDGLILKNPAWGIRVPKPKTKKKYNVFDKKDQELLINSLDITDPVDLMIKVDFATGLRLGEIRGLQWSDFDGKSLRIENQIQSQYIILKDGTRKRITKETDLKTINAERVIPLPKSIAALLTQHKIRQCQDKLLVGKAYKDKNYIFADAMGDFIEKKRPNRRVQSYCEKLGIEKKTFHSIRHSYATRLFEAGVQIKTVQQLMGHSNANVTMDIYTHVMPYKMDNAVELLEQYL